MAKRYCVLLVPVEAFDRIASLLSRLKLHTLGGLRAVCDDAWVALCGGSVAIRLYRLL